MLQKLKLQQLEKLSQSELEDYKTKIKAHKAGLESLKAKGGNDWNEKLQEELDETVLLLVDVDDIIEEKSSAQKTHDYVPKPGTENMVHLSIVRGRRFNPLTGKEESPTYTQMFTFAEWQLFKNAHKDLGYTIMAVLHDPYKQAAAFVLK